MTFTDAYERTIDAKGRIQIPSQIREIMEAAHHGKVLYLVPGARIGTLSLYPLQRFEERAQQLKSELIPDENELNYQQLFYSLASRIELDKQGRVGLPERALKRAKINKEVVLTGVGDHLDLWDKAEYDKFVEDNWGRWQEIQRQARAASRKSERTEA